MVHKSKGRPPSRTRRGESTSVPRPVPTKTRRKGVIREKVDQLREAEKLFERRRKR